MEIGTKINIQREYRPVERTTEKASPIKIEETKVEKIKREIDEGTYKVDLNKTAKLIAKTLI